jgi:hypothetical protein
MGALSLGFESTRCFDLPLTFNKANRICQELNLGPPIVAPAQLERLNEGNLDNGEKYERMRDGREGCFESPKFLVTHRLYGAVTQLDYAYEVGLRENIFTTDRLADILTPECCSSPTFDVISVGYDVTCQHRNSLKRTDAESQILD